MTQIWSYQSTDTDMLGDLRGWEILEMVPNIWWKTRDEAFFDMLTYRLEEIEENMREDPEFTDLQEDRIKLLDPANWSADNAGCVFFQDDYYIIRLVTAVVDA